MAQHLDKYGNEHGQWMARARQPLFVSWECFSCLVVVNCADSTITLELLLRARWAFVSKALPPPSASLGTGALCCQAGMGHSPLDVVPYVRDGKDEEGKFEWCLILLILQHTWSFVLLFEQATICSGFISELLISQVPYSLTQAFFSWEKNFHKATKWHCCSVTVTLRESHRMVPTELQARLLLELL